MRVLVCGGRRYKARKYLFDMMDLIVARTLHHVKPEIILHGAAPGADTFAMQWAFARGFAHRGFPAAWNDLSKADALIRTRPDGTQYDARAGFRRNQLMIDEGKPDLVVAFSGGNGTRDMVERAKRAGITIIHAG